MKRRQPIDIAQHPVGAFDIYDDLHRREIFQEVRDLARGKQSLDLGARQDGAHFITPENGYKGRAAGGNKLLKNLIGIVVAATVKTPAHRDRIIEHKVGHARP
jgi:hypothetical protein